MTAIGHCETQIGPEAKFMNKKALFYLHFFFYHFSPFFHDQQYMRETRQLSVTSFRAKFAEMSSARGQIAKSEKRSTWIIFSDTVATGLSFPRSIA